MFGYITAAAQAIAAAESYKRNQEAFEKLCKSLPIEEAGKLISAIIDHEKEERDFRRKLEIAREGRSLNFWGNR